MLTCTEQITHYLTTLLKCYGLAVQKILPDQPIPGTYWGEPEAGLIGNNLYIRPDTPVHSALHEACHYICMDEQRRQNLHTDAQGDYAEENAVCYLQILLAEQIPGITRARIQQDMDAWGYSFRLGSTKAWFEQDAGDAKEWLLANKIIDNKAQWIWQCHE